VCKLRKGDRVAGTGGAEETRDGAGERYL
jgi:hypothetical protein